MPRIPINGIEMDYQEYGEGDAVVFLHGAGGNLLSWWQQIPTFSEEYRCVTLSHRGFGHSYDVPDGPGMTAFVDDLAALLDHLEIESAHLVAQSMGGRTALGFAVEYATRTRSLVLADTTGGMGEPDVENALNEWRERQPVRELAFRAVSGGFRTKSPDLANLYLQISRTNPPRPNLAGVLSGGPRGAELANLKAPVLFVVGEEDEITPPHVIEMAATHIPGSEVIRVPGCGHSVYFENPAVFNFEVGRFIAQASAPGA